VTILVNRTKLLAFGDILVTFIEYFEVNAQLTKNYYTVTEKEVVMKFHAALFGFLMLFATIITGIGCNNESVVSPDPIAGNTETASQAFLKVGRGQIWADCELFGTVGTPTSFKPTSGNFDELYNTGNFKDGVGAISESKPGDRDYNGGRWHVNVLKEGVNPSKYQNACSVEELDLSDFVGTDTYFECPLLPRRGNN
jgi:hypothetical protein